MRSRTELLLLVACCAFLLFYGLGAFGLLGADEPRYAQVAREMLDRGDWVTPTLNGKPWLEKPPLYYWQAMLSYRVARTLLSAHAAPANDGVTEQTARLPGAVDAAIMVAAIYFFLRRRKLSGERPAIELDAALIAASSAGIIGFAHAASTDMPLTATFTIALLAWYAFYEDGRKLSLAIFYLSLALGTLAKGPVAASLSSRNCRSFRRRQARLECAPPHPLAPRHRTLPRRLAPLVRSRSTSQPRLLSRLHPRAQSRPLLHQRLSPSAAVLVLPAGLSPHCHAVDPMAHHGRHRTPSPDLARAPRRLSPVPKIPGRCFFSSGSQYQFFSSARRNQSCPAISFPPCQPPRCSPPNI